MIWFPGKNVVAYSGAVIPGKNNGPVVAGGSGAE